MLILDSSKCLELSNWIFTILESSKNEVTKRSPKNDVWIQKWPKEDLLKQIFFICLNCFIQKSSN